MVNTKLLIIRVKQLGVSGIFSEILSEIATPVLRISKGVFTADK